MYTLKKHSKYSYVNIVSIPMPNIEKVDFSLCKQPTETPDAFYKRQSKKPAIITNGGFFSMSNGETCFGFRDEGMSVGIAEYPGVGIIGDKQLSYGHNKSATSSLRDFISAYPTLVDAGKRAPITYAKEIDYAARRTAIGWDNDNLYVVTVDSPGLRFFTLTDIFLELGATYAINLDGGGSTRMLVKGKRKTSQISARAVDNVFCVYLKDKKPAKYYRVQVGAFLSKTNADTLKWNLVSKGFTDAYVTKVGIYYKVQLGAFSVKLNAERLKDRLVASGYKPFISYS